MKYIFVFFMMLTWFVFTLFLCVSIVGVMVIMEESGSWFEMPDRIFKTLEE